MTQVRLRVVVHGYPPYHNAGAETYVHQMARWLVARGRDVAVLARGPVAGPSFEGVPVKTRGPVRWLSREAGPGTVLATHLDETPVVEAVAREAGMPLVHILHNHRQLEFHGVTYGSLLVANSKWVSDTVPTRLAEVPRIIVHPPTFVADYRRQHGGDTVTLVNLTKEKGADLFYELARRMPEHRFLAVTGGYGVQMVPPVLPNLEVRPNRPDMGPVWQRTRILLAPSSYESWGKAAVEALASGIPVIAHPTDGLVESLGDAGVFCDRDNVDGWVDAIRALDDADAWQAASQRARTRAEELEAVTVSQLEELDRWLTKLADL